MGLAPCIIPTAIIPCVPCAGGVVVQTDMCRQNQVRRLAKWLVRHKGEERSCPDFMQRHAGFTGLGRDTDGARTLWACIFYVRRKYE